MPAVTHMREQSGFGSIVIQQVLVSKPVAWADLDHRAHGLVPSAVPKTETEESEARAVADDPILILEDDVLIAMDIEATLEEAGYGPVVLCHDLRQARIFLDGTTPGLAFLDVNLGRGETTLAVGVELAERDCPVVFLSGYSGGTVEMPPELRSAPRLAKPFVVGELLAAAERYRGVRPDT